MLRLQALQLYNWGYAPFQEPLPLGDITLLRGNNGSGKTTYLTALALLLGIRHPHRQTYERFLYPGAEWAFIRGIAENPPDTRGQRPFDQILAATYQDQVTLACMLERKGGSWTRAYFIVPGDFTPDPERKIDKDFQFTLAQYQKALSFVGVRDELLRFLEMGLHGARDVPNDPAVRFQFFLKLVGNEEIQQRYAQAKETWRAQQEQTLHKGDELQAAMNTLAELEEQARLARRRRELRTRLEQATALLPHARLRDVRQERTATQAQREAAAATITQTERGIATNEVRRRDFETRRTAWITEYETWKREREEAEQHYSTTQTTFTRIDMAYQHQQREVARLHALPDESPEAAQAILEQAERTFSEADARLRALEVQQRQLEQTLDTLAHNRIPLPDYVTEFLTALQEKGLPYLLLADAVEVLDPTWQTAVEGRLGSERFTVIVDTERDQVRAKQLGEQFKYRHYVSPPNLTRKGTPVPNSLWEVVNVSDERAVGWVYARLAQTRRVSTVTEGHALAAQNLLSITPQAYLQDPRGGLSVWPRELVCGREAHRIRLHETRAQLNQVKTLLTPATTERNQAQLRQREAMSRLEQARARLQLPAFEARLEELRRERGVWAQQLSETQSTYEQLKAREEEFRQQDRALTGEETRLVESKRKLDQELADVRQQQQEAQARLDRLERQIQALELQLSPLTEADRLALERESLSAEDYQQRAREADQELAQLPPAQSVEADEAAEHLYKLQQQRIEYLRDEIAKMRQREQEHRAMFEEAQRDFRDYVRRLFDRQMDATFRKLCTHVEARGEIRLQDDAQDNWHMEVRIGFHDKPLRSLEDAPLSQGQQVITGLFLVLAALQAVQSTPILLLDELMSTLDEVNAPIVLDGLRRTGAQCLIATPHIRPQADAVADVLWALQPITEGQPYAPPVGVLVRGDGRRQS
ncbi:MAG TPA: ATP-binding protein [Anaerolineae bacterium]|nr:ATP-binding protein [Anaerolineae bacterium]